MTKFEYIELLTACKGYTQAEAETMARYFFNNDGTEKND